MASIIRQAMDKMDKMKDNKQSSSQQSETVPLVHFLPLPSIGNISGADPLLYSSMPLNLTGNLITDLAKKTSLSSNDLTPFNNQLNGTTFKRACCMSKKRIPVKIPIPNNFNGNTTNLNKNMNYIEKNINIPDGVCGSYTQGSPDCDQFFAIYCANVKNDYMIANGGNFDPSEFNEYAPECACYGKTLIDYASEKETLSVGDQLKLNYPPKCYMLGCNDPNSAYQDKQSRDNQCNIISCDAQILVQGSSAGRDLSVSGTNVQQNCGGNTSGNTDNTSTTTNTNTTNNTSTSTIIPSQPSISTANPTSPTVSTTQPASNSATPPATATTATAENSSSSIGYYVGGIASSVSSIICIALIVTVIVFIIKRKQ